MFFRTTFKEVQKHPQKERIRGSSSSSESPLNAVSEPHLDGLVYHDGGIYRYLQDCASGFILKYPYHVIHIMYSAVSKGYFLSLLHRTGPFMTNVVSVTMGILISTYLYCLGMVKQLRRFHTQ